MCSVVHYPETEGRSREVRRRYRIFMKQDGFCCYCDEPMWFEGVHKPGAWQKQATTEHIIPKVEKGSGKLDNLACSCSQCNNWRGCIPHEEFKIIRKMDNWKEMSAGYNSVKDKPSLTPKNISWFYNFEYRYRRLDEEGLKETYVMKLINENKFRPHVIPGKVRKRAIRMTRTPIRVILKKKYQFAYS